MRPYAPTLSSALWTFTRVQALAQAVVQAWEESDAGMASPRAERMISRIVRAQRPHFGLHPRQA
jgi:hypothetical protein